eukprot:363937-Chlamydomonas_euryale.AAC.3
MSVQYSDNTYTQCRYVGMASDHPAKQTRSGLVRISVQYSATCTLTAGTRRLNMPSANDDGDVTNRGHLSHILAQTDSRPLWLPHFEVGTPHSAKHTVIKSSSRHAFNTPA